MEVGRLLHPVAAPCLKGDLTGQSLGRASSTASKWSGLGRAASRVGGVSKRKMGERTVSMAIGRAPLQDRNAQSIRTHPGRTTIIRTSSSEYLRTASTFAQKTNLFAAITITNPKTITTCLRRALLHRRHLRIASRLLARTRAHRRQARRLTTTTTIRHTITAMLTGTRTIITQRAASSNRHLSRLRRR